MLFLGSRPANGTKVPKTKCASTPLAMSNHEQLERMKAVKPEKLGVSGYIS